MSDSSEQRRKILTGIAIGCSIAAPVVTVYCTKKGLEKLATMKDSNKTDKLIAMIPYAAGPVALAVTGSVCSALAYNEGSQAIAAVSTAASTTISGLMSTARDYDELVKEAVGEKKYKEIQGKYLDKVAEAPAKDCVKNPDVEIIQDTPDVLKIVGPTEQIVDTGNGDVVFKEKWSNQKIRTSWDAIRAAVNDLNERINGERRGGYDVTVNDFLTKIGAKPTELGDMYYFPEGIKLMNDAEHLYTKNDTDNNPMGIIEFAFGYQPVAVNRPLCRI